MRDRHDAAAIGRRAFLALGGAAGLIGVGAVPACAEDAPRGADEHPGLPAGAQVFEFGDEGYAVLPMASPGQGPALEFSNAPGAPVVARVPHIELPVIPLLEDPATPPEKLVETGMALRVVLSWLTTAGNPEAKATHASFELGLIGSDGQIPYRLVSRTPSTPAYQLSGYPCWTPIDCMFRLGPLSLPLPTRGYALVRVVEDDRPDEDWPASRKPR